MPSADSNTASHPSRRIAVIGGGLTGLAAAHRLMELGREANQPVDVTLLEAGPRLGGIVATREIDGYLVEMGADSFITNKPWAARLCERLGIADRLLPTDETYRRSLVLRRGKPVPVPEGFTLLAPARVWPVLTSPIFSLWGKLRMGLEYVLPRRSPQNDESLAAFVRRRFGQEALERIVQPLVGGIYTSDPEQLSLAATMPRFLEMERQHRSLIRAARRQPAHEGAKASGARYGLFIAPRGGMRELIDALAAKTSEHADVRLGTAVMSLNPPAQPGTPWQIERADGTSHAFDAVIITSRTYQAADLIAPWNAPLADALRQIEYASSAIVVTGHRLADVQHPLDAFGLVIPHIERRKILAVSFASRKFPGRAPDGRVLLRTFVGGAMQPELLRHTDDELIDVVRGELRDLLGVGGREDFAHVARYDQAMPQYHIGHLDRVAKIESLAANYPGLALAGNAYHGVGIPDAIHSGEAAAERILQSLACSTTSSNSCSASSASSSSKP